MGIQFVDSTEHGVKSLTVVRVEKIQKFKGEVVALLTILLIVIDNIFCGKNVLTGYLTLEIYITRAANGFGTLYFKL